MKYIVQYEQETDGRWIAEIEDIPGALAYGDTKEEAIAKAEALALRVVAERIEKQEVILNSTISFVTPWAIGPQQKQEEFSLLCSKLAGN